MMDDLIRKHGLSLSSEYMMSDFELNIRNSFSKLKDVEFI